MNKIAISDFLFRHFLSIFHRDDSKYPVSELVVFILLPIIVGFLFCLDISSLDSDFYAATISCYSIFAALLLSVQMALFGIFQRDNGEKKGKNADQESDRIKERRILIRELNANVSFLIFLSIVAIIISLLFIVMKISEKIEIFFTMSILSHFALVAIVVVKRAYTLFDKEYEI